MAKASLPYPARGGSDPPLFAFKNPTTAQQVFTFLQRVQLYETALDPATFQERHTKVYDSGRSNPFVWTKGAAASAVSLQDEIWFVLNHTKEECEGRIAHLAKGRKFLDTHLDADSKEKLKQEEKEPQVGDIRLQHTERWNNAMKDFAEIDLDKYSGDRFGSEPSE